MFGRRRSGGRRGEDKAEQAPGPEASDDLEPQAGHDEPAGDEKPQVGGGPYDADDAYPDIPRVDLGSLLVPVTPELEVQIVFAEQQGAWVAVGHAGSQLHLQAFAAPKREEIWSDIRTEILAGITEAGGSGEEREGPFGTELLARMPAPPGAPAAGLIPVRFVGIDGPRWFLRGLFQGPSATDAAAAAPLEALIREVVVVRGEHPMPPRDLLELRLPAEAQQALAEQQAAAAAQRATGSQPGGPFNPFERGPEFTETR